MTLPIGFGETPRGSIAIPSTRQAGPASIRILRIA